MPILVSSYQRPPKFLSNGHFQTVYGYYRPLPKIIPIQKRERIFTRDGDFLDLDWSPIGANRLVILSHGLEGDTKRPYIFAMTQFLNQAGWDVLAWNYRGCSGEINHQVRFYHSGETDDLHEVILHAESRGTYSNISLIGFSVGGNITLKYLGENPARLPSKLKRAVAFSVPCDLISGADKLGWAGNQFYLREFLRCFRQKIRLKQKKMPHQISDIGFSRIKNIKHFDERYTAPLNGFKNAQDYWRKSSCLFYLKQIPIPTLLVNAKNDPLLTEKCFPIAEAEENPYFFLETPEAGGHLGFFSKEHHPWFWSEFRALEFLSEP